MTEKLIEKLEERAKRALEADKGSWSIVQGGHMVIKPEDFLEILNYLKGKDMNKVDEWRKVIHSLHGIEETPERVPATEEFFRFCGDAVRDGWEEALAKATLAKQQEFEELEKLERLEKENALDYFYDWEDKWGSKLKPAHTALLAVNSWFIDNHGTDHPVARYIKEKIAEVILE